MHYCEYMRRTLVFLEVIKRWEIVHYGFVQFVRRNWFLTGKGYGTLGAVYLGDVSLDHGWHAASAFVWKA